MTAQERAEASKALQGKSNILAERAAAALEQKWLPSTLSASSATKFRVDELTSMLRDGFVRLGSVIVLSVLVDEPGLIADDILWLQKMFGARHIALNSNDWVADLLHAYGDACADVLPEAPCVLIHDSIERALVLVGELDLH